MLFLAALALGSPLSGAASNDILAVHGALPPPPRGVSDLKFRDMYTMPVGPRGLVPTPRLRELDGRRVRLIGYMVQQETATAGTFLLAPMPLKLGDEDESLADDLPPSVVLVRVSGAAARVIPARNGLIQLIGVLSTVQDTGSVVDGRFFSVRLVPDAAIGRALLQVPRDVAHAGLPDGSPHHHP